MQDYHSPDERWDFFGSKNFEEYAKHYIVKGHFNKHVPADITEGFKTAEYIMAHAYYHYPMYDEAFAKVLRMIEMAVKLKCKSLEIEIGRKNLSTLIDLVSKDLPAVKIQQRLQSVRKVRNSVMHPDRHKFLGGILRMGMVELVNIINELFLPSSLCKGTELEHSRIKQLLNPFEKGLFVLDDGDNRYLLYSIKCYVVLSVDDKWLYFFVGFPILNDVRTEMEDLEVSRLLTWILADLSLSNNILKAREIGSNSEISIEITAKSANTEKKDNFFNQLNRLSPQTVQRYGAIVENSIDKGISEFLYQYSYEGYSFLKENIEQRSTNYLTLDLKP